VIELITTLKRTW